MKLDEFKKTCEDHMFWCFGTSAIFQRRERKLKSRREWITYLGIIGPVIIGSVAGAFGKDWKVADFEILPVLIFLAGIVSIGQITLSVWALVAKWDDAYTAAQDSIKANTALYNRFKHLRDFTTENFQDALKELREENTRQEALDLKQSVSKEEERYAYHEAMRYLGLPCRSCNVVPTGLPNACNSCGNWK